METIAKILIASIGAVLAYFIIRMLLNERGNTHSRAFKYIGALLTLAAGFELIVNWITSEPKIVSQTVEQLKVDPSIVKQIGTYKGYSYNENEIEAIKDFPAIVVITLLGSEAEIQLSVLIDSSEKVIEVKEYSIDTLIKY